MSTTNIVRPQPRLCVGDIVCFGSHVTLKELSDRSIPVDPRGRRYTVTSVRPAGGTDPIGPWWPYSVMLEGPAAIAGYSFPENMLYVDTFASRVPACPFKVGNSVAFKDSTTVDDLVSFNISRVDAVFLRRRVLFKIAGISEIANDHLCRWVLSFETEQAMGYVIPSWVFVGGGETPLVNAVVIAKFTGCPLPVKKRRIIESL